MIQILNGQTDEILYRFNPKESNLTGFYQKIKELEEFSIDYKLKIPTIFEELFKDLPESMKNYDQFNEFLKSLDEEIESHNK